MTLRALVLALAASALMGVAAGACAHKLPKPDTSCALSCPDGGDCAIRCQ